MFCLLIAVVNLIPHKYVHEVAICKKINFEKTSCYTVYDMSIQSTGFFVFFPKQLCLLFLYNIVNT